MNLMFNYKQQLYTEERYNCHLCGDTRERLYVKRTKKGWLYHCFNCGASGFKSSDTTSLDNLKERLKYVRESQESFTGISETNTIILPRDYTTDIPTLGSIWLSSYGITEAEVKQYRFGYSDKLNRLILPLYDSKGELIFWQGRYLSKPDKEHPKYLNMRGPKGKYAIFKSLDKCKIVCLVEDILSAIKVARVADSIPLLGSYISNSLLTYLKDYAKIVCYLDYDKRFESLTYSRRIRLLTGKPCCSIITELDPKEYTTEEIYLKVKGRENTDT